MQISKRIENLKKYNNLNYINMTKLLSNTFYQTFQGWVLSKFQKSRFFPLISICYVGE